MEKMGEISTMAAHLQSILRTLRKEVKRAKQYKKDLAELKASIVLIDQFLKRANSMETIDEDLNTSIKQEQEVLYDTEDAIHDLMHREANPQPGCLPLWYHWRFANRAAGIREALQSHRNTRERITDLSRMIPEEDAVSDSPSSIAYSEENDHQLEGIEDARDTLVRWLTEDSMPRVILVHGAQGAGKTTLVGTVLRDQRVKNHFRYYAWISNLRSLNALEGANLVMWDLTDNNRRSEPPLDEAFQRMREDNNPQTSQNRWVLVLDDARDPRVIEDLQRRFDSARPTVLITTRDSSLESCCETLPSASRTSPNTPGEQSGGAPAENNGYVSSRSRSALIKNVAAAVFRAGLNTQKPQSSGETPNSSNGFHNFRHVSLSDTHSYRLLRREMFSNGPLPSDLEDAFASIFKTCEGLPLAILATRDLWKYKKSHNIGSFAAILKNLGRRLGEDLLSHNNPTTLIRRMTTLRIDQLRNIYPCFFYLSIFPLGCRIRCSTLMRLWMAEGFAIPKCGEEAQVVALENLGKLLNHNIFQEVEKTGYETVRTCRVHNLRHKVIMQRSKDVEFAMTFADLEEAWPDNIWRLSFQSSMHQSASDDGVSSERPQNGIRDGNREQRLSSLLKKVERLRSLLVFEELSPMYMEKLLKQVQGLKVLHLESSSLKSFPEGIPALKYLRYLKLSSTGIGTIHEGIGDLAYLETLDLKGTSVIDLPDGIIKLKKLRHLLVYKSNKNPEASDPKIGVKAPSALGDLNSLQKLCMIELNASEKQAKPWNREQLLEGLGKLTSLRRLGISKLTCADAKLLFSSIKKLTNLEALHLIAEEGEEITFPREATRKAPACLERVHLTGYFTELKNWLHSPNSLTKLVQTRCPLDGDALQKLGELRGLKHLELQQVDNVHEMTFQAEWFPELRFLGLTRIYHLDSIKVDQGALPTLEVLSLTRCHSLKTVPADITRCGKLTRLELFDMPREFKIPVSGNAAARSNMKVRAESWIRGAMEVVNMFPERARGNPPDPRILK